MRQFYKQQWWKWLGVALLIFVFIGGLLIPLRTPEITGIAFPNLPILHESIRNLLFHVPMWFAMVLILFYAFISSILYLATGKINYDIYANQAIQVGILYGILGLTTGMMWAKYTWGAYWPNDPKLNGAAIGMLIYLAYMVLRGSVENEKMKARLASVYNIFAFVIYILFIFVVPRLTDSLHPGNGGNPGFGQYDLDNYLRMFFYPAVIGWTILAFWMISIKVRLNFIQHKIDNHEKEEV